MALVLGLDEAGYGPNLGPLTITATAWEFPDELVSVISDPGTMYDALREVVAAKPDRQRDRAIESAPLIVADSKLVYQPGGTRRHLERAAFGLLGTMGECPRTWRALWEHLADGSTAAFPAIPWYADFDDELPRDLAADELTMLVERLGTGLRRAGMPLVGIRSRAVFPDEFNRRTRQFGSKGALLSHETLALAARLVGDHGGASSSVHIFCDKHGGRNRYRDLIGAHFPESLVMVREESGARSHYCFRLDGGAAVDLYFLVGGEAMLPSAVASMVSKYLRELAMDALNGYWAAHVEGLRPTAGYAVDAKRFRLDIAHAQSALNIADDLLWRCR